MKLNLIVLIKKLFALQKNSHKAVAVIISSIPVTIWLFSMYEVFKVSEIVVYDWSSLSYYLLILVVIMFSVYMFRILGVLYLGIFLGSAKFIKDKLWSKIDEDILGEFCGIRLRRIWSKSELENLIVSELESEGLGDSVTTIPDDIIDKEGALKFVAEVLEKYESKDLTEVLEPYVWTQTSIVLAVSASATILFLSIVIYRKGWVGLLLTLGLSKESAVQLVESMACDPEGRELVLFYTDRLADVYGEESVTLLRRILANADALGLANPSSGGVPGGGGVSADVSPDVSPDVSADVSPRVSPDVSPRVSPDVSPRVSPDVSRPGSPGVD